MKISSQRKQETEFFRNIPTEQRSNFRAQICKREQIQGQQPEFNAKKFPSEGDFDYEGVKLHYYYQKQYENPKALIFFFHGMYFHGNTSGYLSDVVCRKLKVNFYSLDFKNAGKSQGGCEGYYESVKSLTDQAIAFINHIQRTHYGLKGKNVCQQPELLKKGIINRRIPIFISGLSMGGLVTFKLSVLSPWRFAGAIMFSPALADCYEMQPTLKKLGRFLGYWLPTWKLVQQDYKGMNKYLNSQYNTKDEGRYLGKHPSGSAYVLLKELDTLKDEFKDMKVPYILLQSGVDQSVDLFAPLDLEKQAVQIEKEEDKTTLYFKEAWHDILLEEESSEVCQLVVEWLQKRI